VRREKTNYIIQSVSHALDVLEQFSGEHDELGVTELSKRLKLHKNNVFRLLATLESRGYIEQNKATENYRLGIRCLQLGQTYVTQMGLLRQAHPIIESLAQSADETAFVAILRKACVVPLDAVEAKRPVRMTARVGEALPLHCTAAGKVQLAFISDADLREALIEGLRASPTTPSRTIRSCSSNSRRSPTSDTRSSSASTSPRCIRSRCRFATTRATLSAASRSPDRRIG